MESSFSNSNERDLQQLQERLTKTRKDCSKFFELIKRHSEYLLEIRWFACTGIKDGFKRAIQRYFDSLDRDDQVLKESFQEYTSKELQIFRCELISYMDGLEIQIDRRALHESECLMKAREVHAIKEIEKWLNESKIQTQEGMVNEGIALDVGLDSKASTYDTTSTKQQDESSSSGHAADAERARVDNDDVHLTKTHCLRRLFVDSEEEEGESFWEGGDDFGVDVLRFHLSKTDNSLDCMMVVKEIVGRLLEEEEKLEWWFEQDMDKKEERFKGDEDDGEVWKLSD
ncbi:hypothetical protein Tco_0374987 [Tanacetum coccineum]